jgi:hypothetical protein
LAKLLTHQIRVETEEENVTVTIGNDAGVPGGFAKLFNRILDSGAWARLSDAARAAYLPLVRFADQRNHFRVQMGQATLMRYSGLSRSSIKRAVKDLLASKLVVLIEQGGVTADGLNTSNLYQLMVPAEGRKKTPSAGPAPDGEGVQPRTPSRAKRGPGEGSKADPDPAPHRTRPGADRTEDGGVAGEPQYRNRTKELNIRPSRSEPAGGADESRSAAPGSSDAAALLEEKGVSADVARQLASDYPYERVVDVVATMEYRKARGRCDNPGGFLREALVKQWQTPRAVVDARRRAEAKLKQQAADEQARRGRAEEQARQQATTGDEESRLDRLILSLDDEELAILGESVLKKYQGNSAVLQVLTRRPPRQCRLMKMEIAAMLGGDGRR